MAEWGATQPAAWGDGQEDDTTVVSEPVEIIVDTAVTDDDLNKKKMWRIRKNEIEE